MNSPKLNEKLPKNQNNKRPSIPMSPSDSREQIDGDESTPVSFSLISFLKKNCMGFCNL